MIWFRVLLIAGLFLPVFVHAMEDTPENRVAEAERYLEVSPLDELLADMTAELSLTLPEGQREGFEAGMAAVDIEALEDAAVTALVNTFTADEIGALADFYGSELGKSAMKKFGRYMAEFMPLVQSEVMKAMQGMREAN